MLSKIIGMFAGAETEVCPYGCGFKGAHKFFMTKNSQKHPALHMIFEGTGARLLLSNIRNGATRVADAAMNHPGRDLSLN